MSLLLDHGHSQAWFYPLGMIADEVELITSRENTKLANYGVVTQLGVATSSISGSKGVFDKFNELIKSLIGA